MNLEDIETTENDINTEAVEQTELVGLEEAFKALDDQSKLAFFLTCLQNGLEVRVGYNQDKETGLLTHQALLVTCGGLEAMSSPERLQNYFLPVPSNTEELISNAEAAPEQAAIN